MEDLARVDIVQGHCELHKPLEHLLLRKVILGQRALLDLPREVAAFAVGHDET